MTEKREYTILRKFFSSFSDEEIEVIKKNLLAQEGENSKKEALSDNQSFDNLIEKLKYKRSFGSEKKHVHIQHFFHKNIYIFLSQNIKG